MIYSYNDVLHIVDFPTCMEFFFSFFFFSLLKFQETIDTWMAPNNAALNGLPLVCCLTITWIDFRKLLPDKECFHIWCSKAWPYPLIARRSH